MKNLKLFLLLLVAGAGTVFMNACSEDDGTVSTGPTLNFIGDAGYIASNTSLVAGSTFKVGLIGSHDVKIDKLEIRVRYDGGSELVPANCTICDSMVNDKDLRVDYSNTTRNQTGTETWSFTLIDKDGLSTTKEITITTTAAPKPVRFVDVSLGDQGNATLGSSYSLSTFQMYLLAAAKAESAVIDVICVSDDNDGSILCAPSSAVAAEKLPSASGPGSWATKNATKFRKTSITSAQFDAMTDNTKLNEELANTSNTTDKIIQLAGGDVILINPVSTGARPVLAKVVSIGSDKSVTLKLAAEDI